jgi:hypothetical protein
MGGTGNVEVPASPARVNEDWMWDENGEASDPTGL